MTTKKRLVPEVRSGQILDKAVDIARVQGFHKLTRDLIAKRAKVSGGLVSTYFGNMDKLRDEVMKVAVRDGILSIIAHGLAARNPIALKAPEELRQRAVADMAA